MCRIDRFVMTSHQNLPILFQHSSPPHVSRAMEAHGVNGRATHVMRFSTSEFNFAAQQRSAATPFDVSRLDRCTFERVRAHRIVHALLVSSRESTFNRNHLPPSFLSFPLPFAPFTFRPISPIEPVARCILCVSMVHQHNVYVSFIIFVAVILRLAPTEGKRHLGNTIWHILSPSFYHIHRWQHF